jgi:protein-tyrosine-phosphatase
MHLKKMAGPKYMESALFLMELGIPAEVVTNTTLTMAIGNGIHSVDVGLIIAPAIHKEVVSIAEMAGIEYDEHFPEDAEKEQQAKDMLQAKVIAKLKSSKPESKTEISQTMEAMTSPQTEEFEDMREQDVPMEGDDMMAMDQPPQEQAPQEPPNEMGMGLMSRGA